MIKRLRNHFRLVVVRLLGALSDELPQVTPDRNVYDMLPLSLSVDIGILGRHGWEIAVYFKESTQTWGAAADRENWRFMWEVQTNGEGGIAKLREWDDDKGYPTRGTMSREVMRTWAAHTNEDIANRVKGVEENG